MIHWLEHLRVSQNCLEIEDFLQLTLHMHDVQVLRMTTLHTLDYRPYYDYTVR